MQRANAYLALANELGNWRELPPKELVARVSAPARRVAIQLGGEEVEIEIAVAWGNFNKTAVHVIGAANGPSSWRLERLQESIVVSLS